MAKTILEALNELVEKQGGNTEDNKLIVDALNDLVESSGGSSGGNVFAVNYIDEGGIVKANDNGTPIYYTEQELIDLYNSSAIPVTYGVITDFRHGTEEDPNDETIQHTVTGLSYMALNISDDGTLAVVTYSGGWTDGVYSYKEGNYYTQLTID